MNESISAHSVQNLDIALQQQSYNRQHYNSLTQKNYKTFMLLNSLNDLPTMPNPEEMNVQYGENLEQMYFDHNNLISKILKQEEDFIDKHKQNVNDTINCEKSEMQLISQVEQSGSDVEVYVQELDKILMRKVGLIMDLRRDLM